MLQELQLSASRVPAISSHLLISKLVMVIYKLFSLFYKGLTKKLTFVSIKTQKMVFLGGRVVKIKPADAGDTDLIPDPGRVQIL